MKLYNHLTTVPTFLGERLILMMALPIAVQNLTPVVCAGNSSWNGKGVQLEVWKMSSWIWHWWNLLKRRVKETLLSAFTSFVSWFEVIMRFHFEKKVTFGPFSGSFGSDHCQRAAGFLVCQSYFPLCDECQSGNAYLASREECERISMVECKEEWTSAREYGIPLPNCTDLPEQVTSKNAWQHLMWHYYFEAISQGHDSTIVILFSS